MEENRLKEDESESTNLSNLRAKEWMDVVDAEITRTKTSTIQKKMSNSRDENQLRA